MPQNSSDALSKSEVEMELPNQTIHSLGVKLEEMVEQILKARGYSTKTRQKLEGNSGALHEIDVLATKEEKLLAVECKNYSEARTVGIKEIRDFQSKIQDLPQIGNAMFVTNAYFSSEAQTYANHNRITLMEGEKLKDEFYLMKLGRYQSPQEMVLELALPLSMSYGQATRVELVNPLAVRISHVTLVLRPYFLFSYKVDTKKSIFRRGAGIHEEGIRIVDALEGKILTPTENLHPISQSYTFFTKSEFHPRDADQILRDLEENQLIWDLKIIKPQYNYKIESRQYAVVKLESKVPIDAARRMVKEEIMEENRAKYDEVKIYDKSTSIYVPKWIVNIEAKDKVYAREILAASSTVLIDEISLCPKEFFARFRSSKKQTYAVCETCGGAYCSKHIRRRNNNSYFCEDHA